MSNTELIEHYLRLLPSDLNEIVLRVLKGKGTPENILDRVTGVEFVLIKLLAQLVEMNKGVENE